MSLRFTVLASGSGGNASLVQTGDFGVLIDAGLGPRQLESRLQTVGASWSAVNCVLLTHTHSDHWRATTLNQLRKRGIPLYCHIDHQAYLLTCAEEFTALRQAGLVRDYDAGEALELTVGLHCRPLAISHDGGPTFGFRFEGPADAFGERMALAYAADLGCWDDALADALRDVDLLALEFNHDLELERTSGRSPLLISRVLGDHGHLSNHQAADLLREILSRSRQRTLRQLVQLHLSRDCNRAELALAAAQAVAPAGLAIHTAEQDVAGPTMHLAAGTLAQPAGRLRRPAPIRVAAVAQPWLPGLE